MKIILATTNPHKLEEIKAIAKDINFEIELVSKDFDPIENGKTFRENAYIKAKAYYEAFNMPVLTDDSGLILDKLPKEKQPGVYVRRHNGKELSDEEIDERRRVTGFTGGEFGYSI